MIVHCPKCKQEYEVEESFAGKNVECPCGQVFECSTPENNAVKLKHENGPGELTKKDKTLVIAAMVAVIVVVLIGGFMAASYGKRKSLPVSASESVITPEDQFMKTKGWETICKKVKEMAARPSTVEFKTPESITPLKNGWYLITGEMSLLTKMGTKVTPLIEARVKYYEKLDWDSKQAGLSVKSFINNGFLLIETIDVGGNSWLDCTKENREVMGSPEY